MPNASLHIGVHINARPEQVFAYVSDLTKHGEWSAHPLSIRALTSGSIRVGSEYRSQAVANGIEFNAKLHVTEYEPPLRFSFVGEDSTGRFEHRFTLQQQNGGTRVERSIRFDLTFRQWLIFLVLFFPVRLPAARKALNQLKTKMQDQTSH